MPPAPAAQDDPVQWPEPQRAFFQDGPQLLLGDEQRTALSHMDVGARQRWIDEFLARAPNGDSTANLKEGIARRLRLANQQFVSPEDVRAQLLFLNGAPVKRTILDCGTTFKPLEVWSYGAGAAADERRGSLVLYRPSEGEPYRAWTESDDKRDLYSSEMQYWLEQLDGGRLDLRLCKEARLVDQVTGISGLSGKRRKEKEAMQTAHRDYGMRPDGQGEGLLDPPADLAQWARKAAATTLPAGPPALAEPRVELAFPERSGLRLVARAIVLVVPTGRVDADQDAGASDSPGAAAAPAAAGSHTAPAANPAAAAGSAGKPQVVSLTVEGAIENSGQIFESFRLRFRLPAPAAGQPVALDIDRELRPHRPFVMRLKIHDEGSGAEVLVARGFIVPGEPTSLGLSQLAQSLAPALPTGAAAKRQPLPAPEAVDKDSIKILPPDDVVFGLWRAEALITGKRIVRVAFLVDGKVQYSRASPPYSVELRLNRLPAEQVVRVDGFDAGGKLVQSDEIVVNQPHGSLAVAITSPARGTRPAPGRVRAVADVTVPSEKRVEQVEFRLNDTVVAKLTQPPWETNVELPKEGDTLYLTVSAQLDDGSRAEDVRFLRSPQFVEEMAVSLVELYTTVTDGAGKLVYGLTADDFQVLEGGQPQKLQKFQLVENLPLTLGILIDTSGSMASSLGEAQRAAGSFLERMVRRGDRCFTLTFSDTPILRMPLTDDPRAAAESISRLQADGATSIHDALVHSLFYYRGTHGQRALVLLSDGDDTSSQLSFEEAFEFAERSGVAIYVIGLNIPVRYVGIRGKLKRLTDSTGGRVFFVSKAEELAGIYGEIERELRSRYLLAFQSNVTAGSSGFRQIDVKMLKPGLKARTARGYYP